MPPKVDWNSEAVSQAVFKSYKDDGKLLSVCIYGQNNPIKCTSSHYGDYQLALSEAKDLTDGDGITYYSRGTNVYSSKEWFYKIDKSSIGVLNNFSNSSGTDDIDILDRDIDPFKGEEKSVRRVFGPPGTGKTTTARIIHRYINCEEGNACGECHTCKTNPESHMDFTNISAGVNGKVDDIRSLIKSSKIAPYSNKRIIVIDECHQLTGASAEALLVPIEEPSNDTIWILCTTNPEKLKTTLVNRCVRLSMKPVEMMDIAKRLGSIAKKEGVNLVRSEEGKTALKTIADLSSGSMRTAISILESVLYAAAAGEDINSRDVINIYATSAEVDLDKASVSLIAALLNNDLKAAIKFIRVSGNVRGLVNKSRWLLDYLIGSKTSSAKFTPYSGRLFNELAKKKGISVNLSDVLQLQLILVKAEMTLNTTSIDESVILQTAIAEFAFENED